MTDATWVNGAKPAGGAWDGERRSPVRRALSAVAHGLYRPLASDPDRALYFVKHVKHGVWLSEISAWAALG